jgi:hypothetical protein
MRRVRRVRTSTWILTAVFLIALATYLLVRPPYQAPVNGTVQPIFSSTAPATSPAATAPTSPAPQTSTPHPDKTPHSDKTPHPTAVPTVVPATSPPSVGTPAPSGAGSTSP